MPVFSALDMQRPGFSTAMEVMASIPVEPRCISLAALVHEFGLERQAEILEIIAKLKGIGFEICITHLEGRVKKADAGRVVYCRRRGWEYIQRASEAYWEQVWGDAPPGSIVIGGQPARP